MISPTSLMRACRAAAKRAMASPLVLRAEAPAGIIQTKDGRKLQVMVCVANTASATTDDLETQVANSR